MILAHGISQRADLPIPQWLFAWAAAAVLVASFVALTVLWPRPRLEGARERRVLGLSFVPEHQRTRVLQNMKGFPVLHPERESVSMAITDIEIVVYTGGSSTPQYLAPALRAMSESDVHYRGQSAAGARPTSRPPGRGPR